MPKDLTKTDATPGQVIFEWWVKEYEEHERSRRWYVTMAGIGLVLILYSLFTANYLFALIIILFGIILYIHDIEAPYEVHFAITETGIIIGKRFYRFGELNNFWIIYNPPYVKNLYFSRNNLFKNRLQVPLLNYDPRPIRDYLNQFLVEDLEQEEEPLSDRLARLLKLH